MFKGFIYKLTSPSGKVYIGKTSAGSVMDRWRGHCKNAKRGDICKLYNAIRKYGKNRFKIETICEVNTNEDDLSQVEICEIWIHKSYIDKTKGYNLTIGGEGSAGYVHSLDTKLKISSLNTGKSRSDKTKCQMSISASKPFRIVSPEGVPFEGTNLLSFCRNKKLTYSNMNLVINGKTNHCHGWTAK